MPKRKDEDDRPILQSTAAIAPAQPIATPLHNSIQLFQPNQLQILQQYQLQLQVQAQQHHQYIANQQLNLLQRPCHGITLSKIHDARLSDDDKKIVEKGFHLLVGNALRYQASIRGQHGNWPHAAHVKGLIFHNTPTPIWDCVEIDNIIGFRKSDRCSGTKPCGLMHCTQCDQHSAQFFRRCRAESEVYSASQSNVGSTHRFHKLMYRDPTIMVDHMSSYSNTIKGLKKCIRRNRATIERLRAKETMIPNTDDKTVLGDEAALAPSKKANCARSKKLNTREVAASKETVLGDEAALAPSKKANCARSKKLNTREVAASKETVLGDETALAPSKKVNCSRSKKLHTGEDAASKVARKVLKRSHS